jgi:hypothetical protein
MMAAALAEGLQALKMVQDGFDVIVFSCCRGHALLH